MSGLLHLPKQEELFAGFRRNCRSQWGNEDVEQNSTNNVAHRKGHVEPQLRLLESQRDMKAARRVDENCKAQSDMPPLTYANYLRFEKLLTPQKSRSTAGAGAGTGALPIR